MGLMLLALLVAAGATIPTPFVSIGRGPTFDVLGQVNGVQVIDIRTLTTYRPTSGHLNMTTVSVTDGLDAVEALRRWASSDYQIVPRSAVYPPGQTGEQINQRNQQDFNDSQLRAEGAAVSYLDLPATVLVSELTDGSPSQGVLAVGDILTSVAGRPLVKYSDLAAALAATRPGQQIPVSFRRGDGPPQEGTITLGSREGVATGVLGIYPDVRPVDPTEITISLGDIGGPSAGLMFSLGIVDDLTPGDLTGGRFVAGTGTITSTGVVGEIQGIRFKMLAAREAGATVFLVPARNCEEALEAPHDGLQLIKADDLAGAVASLDTLRGGGTPPSC